MEGFLCFMRVSVMLGDAIFLVMVGILLRECWNNFSSIVIALPIITLGFISWRNSGGFIAWNRFAFRNFDPYKFGIYEEIFNPQSAGYIAHDHYHTKAEDFYLLFVSKNEQESRWAIDCVKFVFASHEKNDIYKMMTVLRYAARASERQKKITEILAEAEETKLLKRLRLEGLKV